ncbi:MAG TPA: hypothetical protein VK762_34245 [Polyangiaceae bacterium]|nr:hypothetical protein [Polyangiaceae bacterium]
MRARDTVCGCLLTCTVACSGVLAPSPSDAGVPYAGERRLFVSIADASDVVFVAGGLPADGPDTIGVQVAALPRGVTCEGSTPFTIVACTTIDVTLDVTCTGSPEAAGNDAD